MKLLIVFIALATIFGCSKKDSVNLPDMEPRVALLEANDKLQDIKLNTLDVQISELDVRLALAEDAIDINELNISELFDLVSNLDGELDTLRDNFRDAVMSLRRADRQARRLIRREVRSLRNRLYREIRQRVLADNQLQSEIDLVNSELQILEARQSAFNRFLTRALSLTNLRISQLQSRISYLLTRLNVVVSNIQSQITQINGDIASMRILLNNIQQQLDDVESRLISIIYPCGEDNSEEVLLQTRDGLVAYLQKVKNVIETFTVNTTIPEHFICDRFVGRGNICVRGRNINSSTATSTQTVTHQVIETAFLSRLSDGEYSTTDGFSCNFIIVNGELGGQND